MTWIDYAVLAIIGVSVLFSIIHGFVRGLLSLAGWVGAFVAARYFAADAAALLPAAVPHDSLRIMLGFLAVFVSVLIAAVLLAMLVSGLIKRAGLGPVDRALGAVFGFVRGVAIVAIAALVAGMTALPSTPAWRESFSAGPLEMLARTLQGWLPVDLSKHIHYG